MGRERRLGDSEKERLVRRGLTTLAADPRELLTKDHLVDVLRREEVRIARVVDLDLLEHLPNDHLDVLVVDAHTLDSVDLLDLIDQVLLHLVDALDPKDVVRVDRPLGEAISRLHLVAILHVDVPAVRNEVLLRVGLVLDRDLLHAARALAQLDHAVDFGNDRLVLRLPRLEELRHAGQTAGDVTSLRGLAADLRHHVADLDLLAVTHLEARPGRKGVGPEHGFVRVDHLDVRLKHLLAILDDDRHALLRRLVDLVTQGDALLDVDEANDALLACDDRGVPGVPLEEHVPLLHLGAVGEEDDRSVARLQAVVHRAVVSVEHELAAVADVDEVAFLGLDAAESVLVTKLAVGPRLDARCFDDEARRSADVEGT